MMDCHLIEQAKAKQLTADAIKNELEWIDSVLESDPFDVGIAKCRTCGQIFAYCFKQYISADLEDDYLTFWIPIEAKEIETIRSANPLLKLIGEKVYERPHICWHPDGHIYWAAEGFPMAFVVFLS